MPKMIPRKPRLAKPNRPPGFPLWIHGASGRWVKKVRGVRHYFGRVAADPDGKVALEEWLRVRDDLLTGRSPRAKGDYLTVRALCNHFLTAKARKLEAGELQKRTWLEYKDCAARVITAFTAERAVEDLASDDFGQLRRALAKSRGPIALAGEIQRVRSLFKYAYDAGLVDRPVRCGPEFVKPSAKHQRQERQARPVKMFSADEIRRILDAASVPLRAMVLLAVNCGFGNTDCATLPIAAVDFKRRIVDYPRPKTAVVRRAPLWPETVKALAVVLAVRSEPKDKVDEGLLFITKQGHRWSRLKNGTRIDSIGLEFHKVVCKLGIARSRVGFYALRHLFETVAGETGDQAGVDRIMGHERPDMATRYREWVGDEREDARLRRITDHVHRWLFGTCSLALGKNDGNKGGPSPLRDDSPAGHG